MSESYERIAEKKGFNFTVWEKKKGSHDVAVWMCKSPGFVSIGKSPCGLGTSKEAAFNDCVIHMKEKKINSKAQPGKASAKNAPAPSAKPAS